MAHTPDIVGRGNRDGAALFQKWFAELNQTAETGGQAAYIFVMGSMAELLRVFDLPIVMPEINSLQTACVASRMSTLTRLKTTAIRRIFAGVMADVAVQLRHGEHPMVAFHRLYWRC